MAENPSTDQNSQLFMSLVTSMHVGAMYQLGKVASPISGKVERDLNQAKYTIDLLGMLEEKTKGNLSDDENKFLGRVLSELRMNYIDESKKPGPGPETESKSKTGAKADSAPESKTESDKNESDSTDN